MNLIERVTATQKTVDLYKGKQFEAGKVDCIQLVKSHARRMGRQVKVPKYRDWESAAKVLRKLGFKSLGAALDHHFERIAPVNVLAGDFVEVPGQNGFSSLMVALGNGRALGFHESIPHCDILQPLIVSGAWRIGDV